MAGCCRLSSNGVVKGLGFGNATVTINYQGKTAQSTITVTP